MTEADAILILCAMLNGEPEVRHHYAIDAGDFYVRVDCETETHVIELGLDKRSSLDSVQQAEFFAWLSDKEPMVIIINTDGVEGATEFQIRRTAERLGISYQSISANYLRRWQMTSYLRERHRARH